MKTIRKLGAMLEVKGFVCLASLTMIALALVSYIATVTITPTEQFTVGATTDSWTVYVNEVDEVRYLPGGFTEPTFNTSDADTYAFKAVTDADQICAVKIELTSAVNSSKFSNFDITAKYWSGAAWADETLYAGATGSTTKSYIDGLSSGDAGYIHQGASETTYYLIKVTYSYDLVHETTQVTVIFQYTPLPQDSLDWLSGWGKRVKITIDHNDVDSALSDFPVLVYLSNSSGRNSDDVSFVFDELQSDANRKKIAVTTSDGLNQCYVEIERWDDASEQAWLWVKVPNISNTSYTDLYLYYDDDHVDNTGYVGDTGSTTAENVWDINHILVWHMSEEGDVIDSTSNNNNGTVTGLTSVVGKIGQAKNSSGGSNGIESVNNITLGSGQFTVEGWFNPNVYTTEWIGLFGPKDPSWDENEIMWPYQGRWGYWDWSVTVTSNQPIVADQWDYYAAVREGTGSNQLKNYINGLYDNAGTSTRDFPAQPVWLGKSSDYPWNGISDELRISNISRSVAWIKASYESGRDNLLSFGSEETA